MKNVQLADLVTVEMSLGFLRLYLTPRLSVTVCVLDDRRIKVLAVCIAILWRLVMFVIHVPVIHAHAVAFYARN